MISIERRIRKYLEAGNLELAIKEMLAFTNTRLRPYKNEVIVISMQFQRLKSGIRSGVFNDIREENIQRNQLAHQILEILDSSEEANGQC